MGTPNSPTDGTSPVADANTGLETDFVLGAAHNSGAGFDAEGKEDALRAESEAWDTRTILPAREGDIPVIDLSAYLASRSPGNLKSVARELRMACTEVGFYSLVGHGVSSAQIGGIFAEAQRFHDLSQRQKNRLAMDQDGAIPGAGYLAVGHRKLPRRENGNLNEAFIIKRDHLIDLADNPWPPERTLPGFRARVESYAAALESLARALLPIYAVALEMDADYFTPGFQRPFYRLRLTHYPASDVVHTNAAPFGYGIAPHVDTTFFTLLAQDRPGLCVFSEARQVWIEVPLLDDALIVNTGELLKQWSNDLFLSVKHFANAHSVSDPSTSAALSAQSRYSVPFFFNAHPNYLMHCVPSCCGPDRPSKYPPISYSQSQGVVQGE